MNWILWVVGAAAAAVLVLFPDLLGGLDLTGLLGGTGQ